MLKKLQKKFISIALLALVAIVAVQMLAVNAVNVYQRDSEVRHILYLIAENGGVFPNSYHDSNPLDAILNPFGNVHITVETPYSTRYFVVKLENNLVSGVSTENIKAVSDSRAIEYASQVFREGPGFGFIDNYRYYFAEDSSSGKGIMVFINFEREREATFKLASVSLIVGAACIFLLLFPVYLLSKNAIKPIEQSIQKQKQFITDAGHELKTPIAIISADTEVLEMCEGSNEWLTSIKNQTVRLDGLVKNLVTLSKLNESDPREKTAPFNLSNAALETVQSFETLAMTKGVTFENRIVPNIIYTGNEDEIRQLVSILSDNAVKYCVTGGRITLDVFKSGKSVVISMYNDCENIDRDKLDRLFDRFYRADSSRARETGGYGIGLSIAQVIVQRHKGKITAASSDQKSILIKVIL